MSIMDKVSKADRDNAQMDRNLMKNPPRQLPGMGDTSWDKDSFDASPPKLPPSAFDYPKPSGALGNSASKFGNRNENAAPPRSNSGFGAGAKKSKEDEFYEITKQASKGTLAFIKELVQAGKTFGVANRVSMGKTQATIGTIAASIGGIAMLIKMAPFGLPLLVSGLFTAGSGVMLFMFNYETLQQQKEAEEEAEAEAELDLFAEEETLNTPPPFVPPPLNTEVPAFSYNASPKAPNKPFDFDSPPKPSKPKPFSYMDEDDEDDELDFVPKRSTGRGGAPFSEPSNNEGFGMKKPTSQLPLSFYDDEDDEDEESPLSSLEVAQSVARRTAPTTTNQAPINRENIIEDIHASNTMLTRQYLYEKIMQSLPSINPNFSKVRKIKEGSEEFNAWDSVIQKSAELFKPNKSDVVMPYLQDVEEHLFYILLTIKRVPWLKNASKFADELVNIYAFDEETKTIKPEIYSIGYTSGDCMYVKVMKGENTMVSIKDVYQSVKDQVLDTNHLMPVVIGINEQGKPVFRDFKTLDSILYAGMARSGKTWGLSAIIAQMCFFNSPKELNFYFLDPKGDISDFRFMKMPHVRKFESSNERIIAELTRIIKQEGARRQNIIGQAGFVNIWDYKKKHPDADMPLIYVVIDEIATLSKDMSKEQNQEFQSLIFQLVTRLPAVGIRIFMVPHLVKDSLIKKSTTDLIPCRVSVRGNNEHIEDTVGEKNFPHRLVHTGSMAVRLDNKDAQFVHSAVISSTNEETHAIFDFLQKFWLKVEPSSYEGSLIQQLDIKEKRNQALKEGKPANNISIVDEKKSNEQLTIAPKQATDLSDELNLWG